MADLTETRYQRVAREQRERQVARQRRVKQMQQETENRYRLDRRAARLRRADERIHDNLDHDHSMDS
jgi:hypothetical protein